MCSSDLCADGINVRIEGRTYFLPFATLPRTTVTVEGAEQEAVPLLALVPPEVLEPLSFDGSFTDEQLRVLYDYRLRAAEEEAAPVVVSPEGLAADHLLVEGWTTLLTDPAAGGQQVANLCHVEALRRFFVTRPGGEGEEDEVTLLHLEDLPLETVLTREGEELPGLSFADLLAASGLLGEDEGPSAYDYRLIPADMLGQPDQAVRFPWGHGHLEQLRFVPSLLRTVSLDKEADLEDEDGVASYGGLQGHGGWGSVKVLLEVALLPTPDPAATVDGPDGPYTDPESCAGCHVRRGQVDIPVRCDQCHPR